MSKAQFSLFACLIPALALASCSSQPQPSTAETTAVDLLADVRTICEEVPARYAYFQDRAAYWPETCARAEAAAVSAGDKSASLAVLERMVDDLYEPHAALNTNNQNSPRLVPTGSDLWIEPIDGRYIITAVRPMSGAAKAGLKVGDELISYNSQTPHELAMSRIHAGKADPAPKRLIWAINAAVAGTHAAPRQIDIRREGDLLSFDMEKPEVAQPDELVTAQTLTGNIGYIRLNNSLGNSGTVRAFNAALATLRQTDGLILDLRETASGGSTDIAEPILGRFIDEPAAYQRTVMPNGLVIDRKIKPSGPWTYDKPVIVLVGRWTGSMGEGMAVGFDGMSRGTVAGTDMARLAGGTEGITLEETGINLNLPTYDLHHLNGTPRHEWTPPHHATADNGAGPDLLMQDALSLLTGNQTRP
ncbi:S41 family peptidase [Henriciella litoralis]|uniref:S41 family peptidase n=1 Tax=Henriciella litoralis TaxID=568102 RepID=UPI000A0603C6|nr:S41 family peptidase [Henriciella litoralis]